MWLGPQPNAFSMNFYPCMVLTHWKNILNQRLWEFGVPWSHGLVLGLPPRDGIWKWLKWPWNMIHLMSCRNPCRLYIHLAFTCYVGSSFSTNESARSAMVTSSQSHVWSGLQCWRHYTCSLQSCHFKHEPRALTMYLWEPLNLIERSYHWHGSAKFV